MPILHSRPYFMLRVISNSHYMVTWYAHNINNNELLWNYEFIFYENLKSDLFMKILYYENLEPYGISCKNTFGAIKMWPNKIESYLEVNVCMKRLVTARSDIRMWPRLSITLFCWFVFMFCFVCNCMLQDKPL